MPQKTAVAAALPANRLAALVGFLAALGALIASFVGVFPTGSQNAALAVAALLTKAGIVTTFMHGSQKWDALTRGLPISEAGVRKLLGEGQAPDELPPKAAEQAAAIAESAAKGAAIQAAFSLVDSGRLPADEPLEGAEPTTTAEGTHISDGVESPDYALFPEGEVAKGGRYETTDPVPSAGKDL